MEIRGDSNINRLLKLKGISRLEIKDNLTSLILSQKEEVYPGIKLSFVESKNKDEGGGSWAEYRVLYEVVKYENTADYIKFILSELSKIIDKFSGLSDYISIEEVDCSRSGYYYILVFMLRNIGEEKEESEINKMFKENNI